MNPKFVLAAAVFAVTGCSSGPPALGLAPTVEYVQAGAMPQPEKVGADGSFLYALGPLDKVEVEVVGMPDLTRQLSVDAQGFLSVPLAGAVKATGLTPVELAGILEERMRQNYLRDPDVVVNLVESTSNAITLDGQVRRPGIYPVYRDQTLTQAIAVAGGENDFARVTTVIVFREVSGQKYVGLYDVRAIRRGNYADPSVYPGDRVVVDESQTRRFLDTIQGVTNLLTTPLVLLSRTA